MPIYLPHHTAADERTITIQPATHTQTHTNASTIPGYIDDDDKKSDNETKEIVRREMTFTTFREKWRKINSKAKSSLDPALVWREIKSYIKGSIASLHIDNPDRSQPKQRFLSQDEYVALPRKVSRLDESQRRAVYELYESYEKIKKEGNFFDEMDLVYNLAGRVALFRARLFDQNGDEMTPCRGRLLPIESLYVDEVQDFINGSLCF